MSGEWCEYVIELLERERLNLRHMIRRAGQLSAEYGVGIPIQNEQAALRDVEDALTALDVVLPMTRDLVADPFVPSKTEVGLTVSADLLCQLRDLLDTTPESP